MKYLKKFNESIIEDMRSDLLSVFQDVIDDYDMYEHDPENWVSGLFYFMPTTGAGHMESRIIFLCVGPVDNTFGSYDGDPNSLIRSPILDSIDFSPYLSKLEKMGYAVNIETYKKEGEYIKISIVPEISFDKKARRYFIKEEKFNEIATYNDAQYHMNMIGDLLMEVVDDFDIEKYGQHIGHGLYYNIDKRRGRIRLWMSFLGGITGNKNIKNIDIIKSSKQIKDFEERLNRVGYTFTRNTSNSWYEILISYPDVQPINIDMGFNEIA